MGDQLLHLFSGGKNLLLFDHFLAFLFVSVQIVLHLSQLNLQTFSLLVESIISLTKFFVGFGECVNLKESLFEVFVGQK